MDGATKIDRPYGSAVHPLRDWLVERISDYLPEIGGVIDPQRPLGEYGLDSVVVLALAADIEDHLAISLDPTALWDYATVDRLTAFLLGERARQHHRPLEVAREAS